MRRPGPPDLVALCDLSGSVAAASELLLGPLAPVADGAQEIGPGREAIVARVAEDEEQRRAGEEIARSALEVAEDAAEVRAGVEVERPARRHVPVLDRDRAEAVDVGEEVDAADPPGQGLVSVVPEPRARWNTGDSVLAAYARSCDAVLEGVDLDGLVGAVRRAFG